MSIPGEGPKWRAWSDKWIPALLILLFVAQCAWFISSQSLVVDESAHLAAGLEAWRYGCFRCWGEHPPLPRLLQTAVLGLSGGHIEMAEGRAVGMSPTPQAIAWLTRPVSVLFGTALGVLLWIAGRALLSRGAANFSLALFTLSPSLIAHFSLATTDGLGVTMAFATAVALLFWRKQPSARRSAGLGVVLGVLVLAKFHTLPVFLAALALVFRERRTWLGVRLVLLLGGLAALTVWAGYSFHVSDSPLYEGMPGHSPRDPPRLTSVRVPLPAREFWEGVAAISADIQQGYLGSFMGQVYPTGVGLPYFPTAIVLKWPPLILALLLAVFVLRRPRLPSRPDAHPFVIFPTLFLALALASRLNLGERHILPVYPFVLLAIGGLWEPLSRLRRGVLIAALLVAGQAADTARYSPNYLAYFTPFIAAERAHLYLADSNLDWGQSLIALREYEARNPRQRATLLYHGGVDPRLYGIRAETYDPNRLVHPTVIISATCLAMADIDHPYGAFARRFRNAKPVAIVGHGLHVFRRERIRAAADLPPKLAP